MKPIASTWLLIAICGAILSCSSSPKTLTFRLVGDEGAYQVDTDRVISPQEEAEIQAVVKTMLAPINPTIASLGAIHAVDGGGVYVGWIGFAPDPDNEGEWVSTDGDLVLHKAYQTWVVKDANSLLR